MSARRIDMTTNEICIICGRDTRLDAHAPALEENFPDLRVGACPRCHNGKGGLTARQYDAGMLREHAAKGRARDPSPEPERSYDLVRGAIDLLGAIKFPSDSENQEANVTWELLGTAGARLLW